MRCASTAAWISASRAWLTRASTPMAPVTSLVARAILALSSATVRARLLHLRVLVAVARGQLLQLQFGRRQVVLQAADRAVGQHFGQLAGVADLALARRRVDARRLDRDEFLRQGRQAAHLQVELVVGADDALLLLEGRQLVLRRLERRARVLLLVGEEAAVLLGGIDAQLDGRFQVGLHVGVGHGGREARIGRVVRRC